MTGLYTASTLYHCVNISVAGRRGPAEVRPLRDLSAYRRELYAGVYGGAAAVWGPALLAAVWAVGVVGMALTVARLEIPAGSPAPSIC